MLTSMLCLAFPLLLLYAEEAEYPFFRVEELLGVVALSGLCIALALRAERARFLAAVFGLWTLAAVIAFLVPSPIGENVTRLRGIVLPLALPGLAAAAIFVSAPGPVLVFLAAETVRFLFGRVAVIPSCHLAGRSCPCRG